MHPRQVLAHDERQVEERREVLERADVAGRAYHPRRTALVGCQQDAVWSTQPCTGSPQSMALLPASSARVQVGPPLFCKGPIRYGGFDYAPSHAAFQFHWAETDVYEPISNVKATQKSLAAAGKTAEFYTYPGTTHWFFESDRPDAYNAEAAQLAWDRTVAFLKAHIKGT